MKYKIIKFSKKIRIIINILFILFLLEIFFYLKKQLKSPKVSVFLPIYNKEQFLIRSISSIQKQKLKNIEIIAINDGSTDNTLKILKKLSKNDNRIRIINNDRNHGLLYSRAMGIVYSKGEYLMNLDPDDKLDSNNNLGILYNKAKKFNLDYIKFLLKRIPRNKLEIELCNLKNRLQLINEDLIITNKIIKKEIFLMAYNYFCKEIYKYKWNYHEDNIWNILIIKLSQKSEILKKYIYIYKRNDKSLNMKVGSLMEIKNRIYRLKALIKINENNEKDFIKNYHNYYEYYQNIINSCNISILEDNEIKKNLIHISIKFLTIFNSKTKILENINYILNIISKNKIIIFFNSFNRSLIDYLNIYSINGFFKIEKEQKIIFIDINNLKQINYISKYIYPQDILVGINDIIFNKNFGNIFTIYKKNDFFLIYENKSFYSNIKYNKLNNSKISINKLNNFTNVVNFSFISNSTGIPETITIKIHFLKMDIMDFANYFNYKKNSKKNNQLTILYDNMEYIKVIKNISSKHFQNPRIYSIFNNTNLEKIIKKSNVIITDNIYVMELSAFFFTSCIFYGNFTKNDEIIKKILFHLKYIKYLNDIKELEKDIIDLKNISFKYVIEIIYKNIELMMKIIK